MAKYALSVWIIVVTLVVFSVVFAVVMLSDVVFVKYNESMVQGHIHVLPKGDISVYVEL